MTTSADLRELLRATAERRLTPAEISDALAVPITPAEAAGVLSLVDWFCRRYPTPAERLAYVRRAYRRWSRSTGSTRAIETAKKPVSRYVDLPGGDLVESGLTDLAAGRETVPALLVASFATRLRQLGVDVPAQVVEEPEARLYRLIERDLGDGAHARYCALIERIDSFANSYRCAKQ